MLSLPSIKQNSHKFFCDEAVQRKTPQVLFRGSYTMARKAEKPILPWNELYDPLKTPEDPQMHMDDIHKKSASARVIMSKP